MPNSASDLLVVQVLLADAWWLFAYPLSITREGIGLRLLCGRPKKKCLLDQIFGSTITH